jgi:hypothetical protein
MQIEVAGQRPALPQSQRLGAFACARLIAASASGAISA